MSEGALTITPDGSILFCNQRFAQLMRTPMEDILGHKVHEFVGPAQAPTLAQIVSQAKGGRFAGDWSCGRGMRLSSQSRSRSI